MRTSPTAYLLGRHRRPVRVIARDPLTGLPTGAISGPCWSREIEGVARSGEPALLLMLDIDHFKSINDTHGHLAGDMVLQAVAKVPGPLHPPDGLGGALWRREFAVVLPNCSWSASASRCGAHPAADGRVADDPCRRWPACATISIGGACAPAWVRSTASRCGSSAPMVSCTGPRPRGATGCASTTSRWCRSVQRRSVCCSGICRMPGSGRGLRQRYAECRG